MTAATETRLFINVIGKATDTFENSEWILVEADDLNEWKHSGVKMDQDAFEILECLGGDQDANGYWRDGEGWRRRSVFLVRPKYFVDFLKAAKSCGFELPNRLVKFSTTTERQENDDDRDTAKDF